MKWTSVCNIHSLFWSCAGCIEMEMWAKLRPLFLEILFNENQTKISSSFPFSPSCLLSILWTDDFLVCDLKVVKPLPSPHPLISPVEWSWSVSCVSFQKKNWAIVTLAEAFVKQILWRDQDLAGLEEIRSTLPGPAASCWKQHSCALVYPDGKRARHVHCMHS